jgi:hypothetical protein
VRTNLLVSYDNRQTHEAVTRTPGLRRVGVSQGVMVVRHNNLVRYENKVMTAIGAVGILPFRDLPHSTFDD